MTFTLIDLDEPAETPNAGEKPPHDYAAALKRAIAEPPPLVRTVPPRDDRAVLRSIRALLVFACFTLAVIAMTLVAAATGHTRGGAMTPVPGPTALELSIPGPDPATDYYAHVTFADGTQRDLKVGAWLLYERIVAVEFAVQTDPEQETSCRIAIDGRRVTAEIAYQGATAVCRWAAP